MPRTPASRRHAQDRAQAVTTARASQDEDRSRRMRHYLWAMGVRTACFPLAVWAFATERYALAWVAALGAAIIPTFAVMLANAVDRRRAPLDHGVTSPVQGLGPGAGPPGQEPASDGPSGARAGGTPASGGPIQGTVVSRRETAYPPPGSDDAPGPEPGPRPGPDERREAG